MVKSAFAALAFLCLASGNDLPAATNYCAQIVAGEADQAVGYFSMQINQGLAKYNFNLDLSNFNIKSCNLTNGLMYHIHTDWSNTINNSAAGGVLCAQAAGHYEPNLACGYTSTKCTQLGRQSAAEYNCTPAVYSAGQYSQCQVGDLSGKFGKTYGTNNVFTQSASIPYDVQPPYPANFLAANAISSAWSSVVFHCSDSTRLVCAKLLLVASGASSVCSFPAVLDAVTLNDKVNTQTVIMKHEVSGLIALSVLTFVLFFGILTYFIAHCCQRQGKKSEEERLIQGLKEPVGIEVI